MAGENVAHGLGVAVSLRQAEIHAEDLVSAVVNADYEVGLVLFIICKVTVV